MSRKNVPDHEKKIFYYNSGKRWLSVFVVAGVVGIAGVAIPSGYHTQSVHAETTTQVVKETNAQEKVDQQQVTFKVASVSVKDTNKVFDSATITAKVGDTVNFADYINTNVPGYKTFSNVTQTVKASWADGTVYLLYQPQPQTITIKFVDATTHEALKAPVEITGKETDSIVDLTQEGIETNISGYKLGSSLDTQWVVRGDQNVIELLYVRDTAKVNVHFVSGSNPNKELKPSQQIEATVGDRVDFNTLLDLKVLGYRLMSSGKYTVQSGAVQDVYLLYMGEARDIKVHYIDAKTRQELKPSSILRNEEVGAIVDLTKQGLDTQIAGYDLQNSLESAYVVKIEGNDVYLEYVAKKAPTQPGQTPTVPDKKPGESAKPNKPTQPGKDQTQVGNQQTVTKTPGNAMTGTKGTSNVKATDATTKATGKSAQGALPQTNEAGIAAYGTLAGMLLFATLSLLGIKRKKN